MKPLIMLSQLMVQATLWLMVGLFLVALARRRGPRAASEASVWVLGGLALLTVLSLVPWPAWFPLPEGRQPATPEPKLAVAVEPAPSPPARKEPVWQISDGSTMTDATLLSPAPAPVAVVDTPAAESSMPWWLLAGAWLAATLVCLVRLGLALLAVRRCRRSSRPVTDAGLRSLCDELCQALGVGRAIELRELVGLGSPATIGWRRPIILLPEDWPSWNEAERRAVLAHELAHVQRGDYGRWLLTLCCAASHGYHPLTHWLVRGLRRDQELAADALAAGPTGGIHLYAQALCRLALRRDGGKRLGLARAFLPAHMSLTRRVQMMLQGQNRPERAVSGPRRVLLGVMFLAVCALVAGLRRPSEAEEPAPSATAPAFSTWKNATGYVRSSETPSATAADNRLAEIYRKLSEPITFEFEVREETPLSQAIAELASRTGLAIVIDKSALAEEGISPDVSISVEPLEGISLKSVLHIILRKAASTRLTWVVRDDTVTITTERAARGKLVPRTYQVADLIMPIENYVLRAGLQQDGTAVAEKEAPQRLEDRLIKLIQETIARETWSTNGGPGSIEFFPLGQALLVNQTADVHQQIADLLNALRRLQELEIAVELRMISVSAEMAKQLKREYGIDCGVGRASAEPAAGPQVVQFDDQKAQRLLETLQGDAQSSVMQAPKLSLLNGQQATIQIQETHWFDTDVQTVEQDGQQVAMPKKEAIPLGWALSVQATAAANRQSVQIGLDLRRTQLAPGKVPTVPFTRYITPVFEGGAQGQPIPFTIMLQKPQLREWRVKHALGLPDGGTAVLSGWKMQQEPSKAGEKAEDAYLLVAVTSRIIDREEEMVQAGVNLLEERTDDLKSLLLRYQEACRRGQREQARELAAQALLLDPTCFSGR